jgi:hypothetical protein
LNLFLPRPAERRSIGLHSDVIHHPLIVDPPGISLPVDSSQGERNNHGEWQIEAKIQRISARPPDIGLKSNPIAQKNRGKGPNFGQPIASCNCLYFSYFIGREIGVSNPVVSSLSEFSYK